MKQRMTKKISLLLLTISLCGLLAGVGVHQYQKQQSEKAMQRALVQSMPQVSMQPVSHYLRGHF